MKTLKNVDKIKTIFIDYVSDTDNKYSIPTKTFQFS